MNKEKKGLYFGVLALMLLTLSVWWTAARAHEHATGNIVVIGTDRVIGEDFLAAGRTVEVRARIKGDVVAAGADVTVSGTVEGDVLAAGGNVMVTGPIRDDLRAVGGSILVNAPITDDALLAGGTLVLQPSARVGRDADMTGGEVRVQGPVGRNLALAAGEATLSSEVGGNVQAYVEKLSLQPGALVRGNLVVHSPKPPQISPEAQVLGRVDYHRTESAAERESGFAGRFRGWLLSALWLMVLGSAFLTVSRRWTENIAETMARRPGLSAFAGFLALVAVPVLILLLFITLLGLPLGLLLTALYGMALLLSGIFVAYEIGSWLLRRAGKPEVSPYMRLLAGALILPLLTALPWVGWMFGLAFVILGLGALVLERREFLLRLRAEGLA